MKKKTSRFQLSQLMRNSGVPVQMAGGGLFKKTPRGMVITLGDVLFDADKARLESGGMRNVQKLADFLKVQGAHSS